MKKFEDLPQETIDKFYDEAAKILDDLWWCSRKWSGWQYKTMRQDDFVYAPEDEQLMEHTAKRLYEERQKQPL